MSSLFYKVDKFILNELNMIFTISSNMSHPITSSNFDTIFFYLRITRSLRYTDFRLYIVLGHIHHKRWVI